MVRCNYKMSFLAANTQDGFGAHRDKKYPMCTMKYTAVFLMLWAYILLDVLDRGIMAHSSEGAPSDFWAKWILNAASKRQNIADSFFLYLIQSHQRD